MAKMKVQAIKAKRRVDQSGETGRGLCQGSRGLAKASLYGNPNINWPWQGPWSLRNGPLPVSSVRSPFLFCLQAMTMMTSMVDMAYTPVTVPFFVTPLLITGLLVFASLQLFYGNGVRGFVIVAMYLMALSLISVQELLGNIGRRAGRNSDGLVTEIFMPHSASGHGHPLIDDSSNASEYILQHLEQYCYLKHWQESIRSAEVL